MNLFRPEALRSQDRLHGDVNLVPPVSWQVITGLILLIFVCAGIFLAVAQHARIATARGIIESDRGTIETKIARAGIVDKILVEEGSLVRKGEVLAIIRHDVDTGSGNLQNIRSNAIEEEGRSIGAQSLAMRTAAEARINTYSAEAQAARQDQAGLSARISEQRTLIEAARDDLAKAQDVAKRGFVSQQDLRKREEKLAQRRQDLALLQQEYASAIASQRTASSNIARERAELSESLSGAQGQLAILSGRKAEDGNITQTKILASADGIVSSLPLAAGAAASSEAMVATLMPTGGVLQARINLPDSAVPMVAPGQVAMLSIDAFPYQTYGTVKARIVRVSETAVETPTGKSFVALAEIERPSISSYGKERELRPGMVLTARIRTMERSLLQWLLDPVYAVTKQ